MASFFLHVDDGNIRQPHPGYTIGQAEEMPVGSRVWGLGTGRSCYLGFF